MDRDALPPASIKAGQEFDDALQKLGFRADGLFWAWDRTIEQFVLVLVTEHFDYAGPHAVSGVLLDAYRAAATPAEISPFIVRVHSPRQAIIRNMMVVDAHDQTGKRVENINAAGEIADLQYVNHWVYRWPPTDMIKATKKKREPTARSREWRKIVSAVDRLAA
ncbi:hypothetical protein WBP07_12560 [Novosphingobium sp. BL-8A]|uniref:hypothetical protein n=1 Tax=Novosphingobium sp. BL-8A TaxID=3127639 RepID=UPI003756913B